MNNLLKETVEVLKEHGKDLNDIKFISNSFGWLSWGKFQIEANRLYDDGYGALVVDPNLVIVGDDWWLERAEYDGAEWWEFKTMPERPTEEDESYHIFI